MNERIFQIRKSLKLSQDKFGENLGVTKTGISKIERGERNLTDTMFKLICTTYGVNEMWLRTGVGEMFATTDLDEKLAWNAGLLMGGDDKLKKLFVLGAQELAKNDATWEIIKPILLEAVSIIRDDEENNE